MNEVPLAALFAALVVLLVLSGFFSGSETGLMALNRYRLRHLAKSGHPDARRASRLLEKPDRLIGLILLGNNFVNILASSLATIIALRLVGEAGIALAAGLLTLAILVFSEVAPKTLAAFHPERFAFPASRVLAPLLKLLSPLVSVVNYLANALLRPFGILTDANGDQALSSDELRTVVMEAGNMIPMRHRRMLLSILELQEVTVEDIMVPRNEVVGINLDDDWDDIFAQVTNSPYSKLLVYRDTVDNVVGILHLRKVVGVLAQKGHLDRAELEGLIREPYFVPENTPLNTQLVNFQKQGRRRALVVDEYGDLLGLVTLEDILEEIVGEFTSDPSDQSKDVDRQADGSYMVEGTTSIRSLNRLLNWQLPIDGPRTVNGLIMEYLESLPEPGTSLTIAGHTVEIVETDDRVVKTARIRSTPG